MTTQKPVRTFRTRVYSVSGFFHDIFSVATHPVLAIRAMWGKTISAHFRQRLMLAVSAVNGCRYCTYLHTREALRVGLTYEEISSLLDGLFDTVPEDEGKAILYAQHWADNNARPDPEVRNSLYKAYGMEISRVIMMVMLLIRIGNLCGNSFDYMLFRISCGHWGLSKRDAI